MSVTEVTDASFDEEVRKVQGIVLVDFWAPWCGPCRMIAPSIDEIAEEYKDILKVVKINTDKNPTTAAEYAIRSIPTVIIFINGKKVDTVIGAVPKSTLLTTLDKHLSKQNK